MEYDNYPMVRDGPVPLFDLAASPPEPLPWSPGRLWSPPEPLFWSPGPFSSTPETLSSSPMALGASLLSPPFSPDIEEPKEDDGIVTAHVHLPGHISLYLHKGVRVDVSANGTVMIANPRQGIFIALGCYASQLAVIHPYGRILQNKARIEIQAQDRSLKSAKIWQRGISFTTSDCALSYLVDTAGARSTTDSFRHLYSRNIAQGKDGYAAALYL